MNTTAIIALAMGVAAVLFGAWGHFSSTGRSRFDEMAGIIPYSAWYAGLGLVSVSVCLWIVIWIRK